MIIPVAHKGIYYWPSFEAAREYAIERGHPTDRIISYQLGWAIQLRVSGPYVGPLADVPNKAAGPDLVCWEHQANREPIRLSFSIKVF